MNLEYKDYPNIIDYATINVSDFEKIKIFVNEPLEPTDTQWFNISMITTNFGTENETTMKLSFEDAKNFYVVMNKLLCKMKPQTT